MDTITLKIEPHEGFDPENNEFIDIPGREYTVSHTLKTVAEWESRYHIPFVQMQEKATPEQILDYYNIMCNTDDDLESILDTDAIEKINKYMRDPHSAGWIKQSSSANNGTVTTADLIYAQMVILRISKECENWHFNRLQKLIAFTAELQKPPKKQGANSAARQMELRRQRRAKENGL
jgi:hypothetical protein